MTHELKTLPEYYAAVQRGTKPFEIRRNDRDFAVGDLLILREWDGEKYTDNLTGKIVTYVFKGGKYGVEDGFVVMGIRSFFPGESRTISPGCKLADFWLGREAT